MQRQASGLDLNNKMSSPDRVEYGTRPARGPSHATPYFSVRPVLFDRRLRRTMGRRRRTCQVRTAGGPGDAATVLGYAPYRPSVFRMVRPAGLKG